MKLYRYAGREGRPQLGIEIEGKVAALTDVFRACGESVPAEIEAADLVAMVSAGQTIAAQIAGAVDRIAKSGGVKDMECVPADSLRLLHPQRVLERGFALLQDETGHVLSQRTDFHAGQHIVATVRDGQVPLTPRLDAGKPGH